ncbi:hypothetical protein D3Z50_03910 [Clostridiaceae bacterium]|nr:hypothetical protein [Clostridiaceae bacterium]
MKHVPENKTGGPAGVISGSGPPFRTLAGTFLRRFDTINIGAVQCDPCKSGDIINLFIFLFKIKKYRIVLKIGY